MPMTDGQADSLRSLTTRLLFVITWYHRKKEILDGEILESGQLISLISNSKRSNNRQNLR